MVGGRCIMINIMEEGTSSSAQRSTLPFKGVGWRRCSSLERIQILCEVAKGRALQSPSPVTRPPSDGICLARSDHETTRVYSMWPTIWPWDPRWSWTSPTSCSPCEADLRAVLQLNCSSSGGATPAAVIVLYLFSTLSVTTLTAQSLVPVECCLFFAMLDHVLNW